MTAVALTRAATENVPLVIFCAVVIVALLLGAYVAEKRATRREHREADALRRARSVTSPKGR